MPTMSPRERWLAEKTRLLIAELNADARAKGILVHDEKVRVSIGFTSKTTRRYLYTRPQPIVCCLPANTTYELVAPAHLTARGFQKILSQLQSADCRMFLQTLIGEFGNQCDEFSLLLSYYTPRWFDFTIPRNARRQINTELAKAKTKKHYRVVISGTRVQLFQVMLKEKKK